MGVGLTLRHSRHKWRVEATRVVEKAVISSILIKHERQSSTYWSKPGGGAHKYMGMSVLSTMISDHERFK